MLAAAVVAAVAVSGVHGIALIDPARPVCTVGVPCSAPDAHDVVAFWRGGHRAATAVTGANGRFRIRLAPGLYRVTFPSRTRLSGLAPRTVRVLRGKSTGVTFRIDVGIR